MKIKLNKVIIAFLLIVIFLSNSSYENKCYATTVTLSQLEEKFKMSDYVKEYEGASTENSTRTVTTSVTDTTFIINLSQTGYSENNNHAQSFLTLKKIIFNLENDILTNDEVGDSKSITIDLAKTMISCVAQLHGYTEDFINEVLNRKEITDYTVDKEGFEIKDNNDGFSVKINLRQMKLPENKDNEEGEKEPTKPSQEENKKDEQKQPTNEQNNIEDNTIKKEKLPNTGVLNLSVK